MKKFYTEKDIDELFKSGARSLRLDDAITLTDLAYEKAKQLGLQLLSDGAQPASTANVPIRPYLSDTQRIRSSVLARLGNQVDAKLLDVIIQRVLKSTGVK